VHSFSTSTKEDDIVNLQNVGTNYLVGQRHIPEALSPQ